MNSLNTIRRLNAQAIAARATPAPFVKRAVVLYRNPNTGSYAPVYQAQPEPPSAQLLFYAFAAAAHTADNHS